MNMSGFYTKVISHGHVVCAPDMHHVQGALMYLKTWIHWG